jgi:hypothetical protein
VQKLILKDASAKEYLIGSGITIGSADTNTIVIKHHKVEPQHAKVQKSGEHIYIEDIDTQHGIAVNGKNVRRWALKPDDVVAIGGSLLVYIEEDKPAAAPKKEVAASAASGKSSAALKTASSASSAALATAQPNTGGSTRAMLPVVPKTGTSAASGPRPAVSNASSAALKTVQPAANSKSSDSLKTVQAPANSKSSDSLKSIQPAGSKDSSKTIQTPSGNSTRSMPVAKSNSASGITPIVSGISNRLPNPKGNSSASLPTVGGGSADTPSARSSALLKAVSAATSSRFNMPAASSSQSGLLRAQGSSQRMSPAGSGELQTVADEALAAKASATSRANKPREYEAQGKRGLLILAGGVILVLLVIVGIMSVVQRNPEVQAANQEEREAMERLKQPTPKNPKDLRVLRDKLLKAKKWEEVTAILGEPQFTHTGPIPLFSEEKGTVDYPGAEFRGYYIQDARDSANNQESTIVYLLLFQFESDGRFRCMDTQKYSKVPLLPSKTEPTEQPERTIDQESVPTPPPAN